MISLISISLSIISLEINSKDTCSTLSSLSLFERIKFNQPNAVYYILSLIINNILSSLLIVNIFLKYNLQLKYDLKLKLINPLTTLSSHTYIYYIFFEILISIPQPFTVFIDVCIPVKMTTRLSSQYEINKILSTLLLLRLYFIFHAVLYFTFYKSHTANTISYLYSEQKQSDFFVVKCLYQYSPIIFTLCLYIFFLLIFSLLLHIYEQPFIMDERKIEYISEYSESNDITIYDYKDFFNCVWCIVIAMTTIGYGDYVPNSIVGKICVISATAGGMISLALFINGLVRYLTIDSIHLNLMMLMKRMELTDKIKEIDDNIMNSMTYRGYLAFLYEKYKKKSIRKKIENVEGKVESLICMRNKLLVDKNNITKDFYFKERVSDNIKGFREVLQENCEKLNKTLKQLENSTKDKRKIIMNLQTTILKNEQKKIVDKSKQNKV